MPDPLYPSIKKATSWGRLLFFIACKRVLSLCKHQLESVQNRYITIGENVILAKRKF